MNIFYCSDIGSDIVILSESESHHAVKVLRMQTGDKIMILDGKGTIAKAEVLSLHPKSCECKVMEKTLFSSRPFHLHIAIAPTKLNDRFEWFLEKAAEIGAEEITPVICSRSERRQTNHERFCKVLLAATKQSMNPYMPVLNEQVEYDKFIATQVPGFIAHCYDGKKLLLKDVAINKKRITILVGPEGDFTETEINNALQKEWIAVSLGSTRLRTETAGVIAAHTVTLVNS